MMEEGSVSPNGNVLERMSSVEDDGEYMDYLAQLKDEALYPVKQDLCEWLHTLLGVDISPETFVDVLDTGVIVCRVAELIQNKAQENYKNGISPQKPPATQITYQRRAKSGTWFSRDNTANFIQWCKDYNIKNECLFETEGLVLHKDTRRVVLCLLEIARLAQKHGLVTSSLIEMEKEIEEEEQKGGGDQDGGGETETAGARIQELSLDEVGTETVGSLDGFSAAKNNSIESGPVVESPTKPRQPPISGKLDDLDEEVNRLSGVCRCGEDYPIKRISKGKYSIGGKQLFIRLLQGQHAMVRVGGGWDTLQHYLLTHDPCRARHHKREGRGEILVIQSRYKSS